MNTAFRSLIFEKDFTIARAWVLALIINMVGAQILDYFAIITITRAPFFWPALIVGGLLFGVGMTLAGGCTSGTWYRCGIGMVGSLFALAGFVFGATMASVGQLSGLSRLLRSYTIDIYGEELTLYNLFPGDPFVWQWIVTAVLAIVGAIWLLRAPKSKFSVGWNWRLTGVAIGVIGIAAWLFSALSQRNFGLSFTQPTVSISRYLLFSDEGGINWGTWLVIGVPFGSLISGIVAKEFALRISTPNRAIMQLVGGTLMGIGASIAGGCNIGHGLTGISTLALSSVVSTLFTILGVWGATWVIIRRTRLAGV